MRRMSKSVLRVAQEALAVGRAALPPYGSRFSRHDYTQPQLFALLVLKQFLRTDYRGLVVVAAEWRDLRHALGLRKVPHTTRRWPTRRAGCWPGRKKGDLPPCPGRGRRPRPRGRPDRRRAGGRGGRHRARGPARQHLLPQAPRRGQASGTAQAGLAEAHGGCPHPLASDPGRGHRHRPDPGLARLRPGGAPGRRPARPRHGAGRRGLRRRAQPPPLSRRARHAPERHRAQPAQHRAALAEDALQARDAQALPARPVPSALACREPSGASAPPSPPAAPPPRRANSSCGSSPIT